MKILLTMITLLAAGTALAADSEKRRHPDPACLERDADPEKCVIQNGPPPAPRVRKKVELPPALPVTQPPTPQQTSPPRKP